ncbi:MAG: hypothetical protein AVDCRST_MAG51-648, partial [uncultured Ramlibacter sp.]
GRFSESRQDLPEQVRRLQRPR